MKILLADIQTRQLPINKDLAGGFGTASTFGTSWFAKTLIRLKKASVYFPLWSFGIIAAILKSKGAIISFLTDPGQLPSAVDIVIIYASMPEHTAEIAFARSVRQKRPDAKIFFFGTIASISPETFLAESDAVLVGEPEQFFLNRTLEELLQLQAIIQCEPVDELDKLPLPDWKAFPVSQYRYIYFGNTPALPVSGGRGCPYPCGYYCPYPILQGKKRRVLSCEKVIDIIKTYRSDYNISALFFRDPFFSFSKERVAEICSLIIKEDLKIRWSCETHLDSLDKETIDIMAASGLAGINVGIETADDTILQSSQRKQAEFAHQEKIIAYCERKGIQIGAFYIIGNLAETFTSFKKTLDYAKRLNTSYAQFTLMTPYPGTKLFTELTQKGLINIWEYDKYDAYTPIFKHPNLSAEDLEKLKNSAFRSYYLRPCFISNYLKKLLFP